MVIKSDGNGSFVITKAGMGVVIFLITIFTILASVVTTAVTVQSDVENNAQDIQEIENSVDLLKESINNQNIATARIETKLENIQKSLDKIEKKIGD